MATASVTGIVAQMLEREPGLNPNQVKDRLPTTARPVPPANPNVSGQGVVDAFAGSYAGTTDEAIRA